ncbi:cobalamin biosynthesis protein [Actinoplanes sp. NPDC051346]|uniref:cobalamin biosynthesis protein n=1 Tax=Actinoplanes sp. NPDC051346 TaxID=3155048 RepID=UPI00342DBADC
MTLGVGVRSGVSATAVDEAIDTALALVGFSSTEVVALATLDSRAPVLQPVAARRGWPLLLFPPELLADVVVPHPSARVATLAGVPSVAEAAALAAAGPDAVLVLPKRVLGHVTVAIARRPPA